MTTPGLRCPPRPLRRRCRRVADGHDSGATNAVALPTSGPLGVARTAPSTAIWRARHRNERHEAAPRQDPAQRGHAADGLLGGRSSRTCTPFCGGQLSIAGVLFGFLILNVDALPSSSSTSWEQHNYSAVAVPPADTDLHHVDQLDGRLRRHLARPPRRLSGFGSFAGKSAPWTVVAFV